MKEEQKLRSFVDIIESEIGLKNQKGQKLGAGSKLDECLYRLFLAKCSEGIPLSGPVVRSQAVKFKDDLHGNNNFFASDGWFSWWKSCSGIN